MRSETDSKTILISDDEAEVRSYLETALRCQGYAVETAQDGEEVLSCLHGQPDISAVLLDLIMPRQGGLETLRQIRSINKDLPVIVVSGAGSPLNVVEAMRSGATDFLGKPINHEDLRKTLKKALERERQAAYVPAERNVATTVTETFLGNNPQVKAIQAIAHQVGWSEAPVLIQGETGVGKEVLARLIHSSSPRAHKPLLKINCAALPSELVESELFGYERGAFTGAFQKKLGMFELADGGTILLDEIGDMDYKLQAKLLQVLQDNEFQRLGGKETTRVNVRILCATHNDLENAVSQGTFRQDLYYRLNVITLHVPPLRDRKEDIIPMAEYLYQRHAGANQPMVPLSAPLKHAMLTYDWPGNIRELENVVRRLLVLGAQETIAEDLLSAMSRKSGSPPAVPVQSEPSLQPVSGIPSLEQVTQAKHQAERDTILAALHSTHWNRKQAAVLLKIDYKALLYKIKKLGLEDTLTA
jgi:two-component system, NtrC family, response regulator AtoC